MYDASIDTTKDYTKEATRKDASPQRGTWGKQRWTVQMKYETPNASMKHGHYDIRTR